MIMKLDWLDSSDDDIAVVSSSGSSSSNKSPFTVSSETSSDSSSGTSSSNTEPRRSSRKNKGVPPERYGINAIYELKSIYIPKNVEEVMRDKRESSGW